MAACTRAVELTQTPWTPPQPTPTLEGALTALETAPMVQQQGTTVPTTATIESSPAAPSAVHYAVVFLAKGEVLNVRRQPGVTSEVIGTLPANTRDLRPTGGRQEVEGVLWIEIVQPEGSVGWVSSRFLTEQTNAAQVCADPQVGALLDQLISAVRDRDGRLLATLVSPWHGLTIHHNVWNPAVQFDDPEVISVLFESSVDYDWGTHEASGEALIGPFKEYILPRLEDVLLQNHTRNCNTLERGVATGGTTGYVYWPYDYASLNYVALFRPPPPEQELDWRTWAIGIDYIDGKPYLAVLIQFYWEI